jgi:hypothetical protein
MSRGRARQWYSTAAGRVKVDACVGSKAPAKPFLGYFIANKTSSYLIFRPLCGAKAQLLEVGFVICTIC